MQKNGCTKVNPEVKSEFDTAVSELIELDRYYNKIKHIPMIGLKWRYSP